MADEDIVLTPEGLQKLKDELEELKTVKRRELAQRLKTAISYGDLRENSEYHSAKDEQAFVETRILTIENILRKAKVVSAVDTSSVQVGSVVRLRDVELGETMEYRIVGPAEADVNENKISYESPLGQALLGKSAGSRITVHAPMGEIAYELLEIRAE